MDVIQRSQREGFDITANHMEDVSTGKSEIREFYKDATLFIDGASGFLGKLTLEKFLSTCEGVKKIYILLRPKKGKDIKERFQQLFDSPVYEPLKRNHPDFMKKVAVMSGDCLEPNLGLNDTDREIFVNEVNFIFHIAATVRFDEKIRQATYINVRATRDIITLAKQCKNLKCFIHVSTAFSNCDRPYIEEKFYDIPINSKQLLTLIENFDDKYLDAMTPILLGEYPNTYVFTKVVAEDVVRTEGKNLPIALVRPSIVLGTSKQPIAGWTDNVYGPTGVTLGTALGVIRSLNADPNKVADMVPADHVVNTIVTAPWDVIDTKSVHENNESVRGNETVIYNYVSGPENPITWRDYVAYAEKHIIQVKSPLQVWHYCFALRPNIHAHNFAVLFLHMLPAYLVDFILLCIGKTPMLVKGYTKIAKFSNVIAYFATRQWKFSNRNTKNLYKKLTETDKLLFNMSMSDFSWDEYFYTFVRGCRVYLLNDPLETIPKGKVKYRILQIAHYTLVTLLIYLLYKLISSIYSVIFG